MILAGRLQPGIGTPTPDICMSYGVARESGIRESNPSHSLGKAGHSRYTNPAKTPLNLVAVHVEFKRKLRGQNRQDCEGSSGTWASICTFRGRGRAGRTRSPEAPVALDDCSTCPVDPCYSRNRLTIRRVRPSSASWDVGLGQACCRSYCHRDASFQRKAAVRPGRQNFCLPLEIRRRLRRNGRRKAGLPPSSRPRPPALPPGDHCCPPLHRIRRANRDHWLHVSVPHRFRERRRRDEWRDRRPPQSLQVELARVQSWDSPERVCESCA